MTMAANQWKYAWDTPQDFVAEDGPNLNYEQMAIPSNEADLGIGHTEVNHAIAEQQRPLAWAYVDGKLLFRPDHTKITLQDLLPVYGNDSFDVLKEVYTGRFDFVRNGVTIRRLKGWTDSPPDELPEMLCSAFKTECSHRKLPQPNFIPIMPYEGNEPIWNSSGWKYVCADADDMFVKYAQKDYSKYYKRDFTIEIADRNRYETDRSDITLAMRENEEGYSISCMVYASHVGVAAYVQYWHYKEDEFEQAIKTFNRVKRVSAKMGHEVDHAHIPMSVIIPMFRSGLQDIDIGHRERSGVYNFNQSLEVATESDWRTTIYGPRYPTHYVGALHSNWNIDEKSKEIALTGGTNRSKVFHYKYAQKSVGAFDFRFWPFAGAFLGTITTGAAVLAWFMSNGGNLENFKTYIEPKIEQAQQISQQTNELQDISILETSIEKALIANDSVEEQSDSTEEQSGAVDLSVWYGRIADFESGSSNDTSGTGARGVMQIMPPTWKEWTQKIYGTELDIQFADNPEINRKVGETYLKWIQDTLRQWMGREPGIEHILASYNGGIGRLRKLNFDVWKMPEETQEYVRLLGGPDVPPKAMTMLQSPKQRSEGIPPNYIPPFSSRQVELLKEKRAFFEIGHAVSKLQVMKLVESLSAENAWHDIVRVLLERNVPKEWFSDLNYAFQIGKSKLSGSNTSKIRQKTVVAN